MRLWKRAPTVSPVVLPPTVGVDSWPDFWAMTVDELIQWKLARKREVDSLKAVMRIAHAVYTDKLELWHAQQALKRAGLEGIVLSPGPASLEVEGK